MSRTSEVLLHNTADTMNVTGAPFDAAGRHRFSVAIHTAALTGTVVIEATLVPEPAEQDWFPVIGPITYPRLGQKETRDAQGVSFKGSYAFVRAKLIRPGVSDQTSTNGMFGFVDRILINA